MKSEETYEKLYTEALRHLRCMVRTRNNFSLESYEALTKHDIVLRRHMDVENLHRKANAFLKDRSSD